MPLLIDHIDKIARAKQRDVLFLTFDNIPKSGRTKKKPEHFESVDWETHQSRLQIIAWLDGNEISWRPCGGFADTESMLSYAGQIYLDVPFAPEMPEYQKLVEYLEFPDGSMRWPGIRFFALSLRIAMQNAPHDEPGFWEKWGDQF